MKKPTYIVARHTAPQSKTEFIALVYTHTDGKKHGFVSAISPIISPYAHTVQLCLDMEEAKLLKAPRAMRRDIERQITKLLKDDVCGPKILTI